MSTKTKNILIEFGIGMLIAMTCIFIYDKAHGNYSMKPSPAFELECRLCGIKLSLDDIHDMANLIVQKLGYLPENHGILFKIRALKGAMLSDLEEYYYKTDKHFDFKRCTKEMTYRCIEVK